MKAKTLRRKDTKEFVNIVFSEIFISELPYFLAETVTIELLCDSYKDIDFSEYEIVELDIIESDIIGADIRNKLSPLKNLLSLLKVRDKCDYVEFNELTKFINREIEQGKISIDYLAKLL